ncbi:hypothetical protein NG819_07900 [Pseudarthrobacter sp. Fe7]|nr:hypothetical protein NG819_07900 [Pseudarthrobacter sp. Fe7]
MGLTLAEYRGDAPCAIDANPDSGDLVERALGEGIYQQSSPRTITGLLENIDSIDSLTSLARYMHHAGRLHLIAGEQDPEVSDSLTAEEYLRIRKLISSYYSVVLTDCGTGVTHNAMSGILQSTDNLVIAAGYAVSGAKRARSTLHWLASHGYEEPGPQRDRGHHGQGRGLLPRGQGRHRGAPLRDLPRAHCRAARPRRCGRRPGDPRRSQAGDAAGVQGNCRGHRGRVPVGLSTYVSVVRAEFPVRSVVVSPKEGWMGSARKQYVPNELLSRLVGQRLYSVEFVLNDYVQPAVRQRRRARPRDIELLRVARHPPGWPRLARAGAWLRRRLAPADARHGHWHQRSHG